MKSSEIRSRFLKFFEKRGHAVIPSASLVTPDEKGITNPTLFNTSGMQPLIPYLLGETHPGGKRIADVQKCVRTVDIEEIGDKTHATFFEMVGYWSLGDYFKKDALTWSYEFLMSKEEGLGLDPRRFYVTVFEGDTNAEKDTESAAIWESLGIPKHRIYFKDASANWWPAVKPGKEDGWTGPTGPCSEMFYDLTPEGLGDMTPEEYDQADKDQKIVEIGNNVFMEFEKKEGKIVAKLSQKNVDMGGGFERLVMVMQNVDSIFDTDLFKEVMTKIHTERMKRSGAAFAGAPSIDADTSGWTRRNRILADHLRTSAFMISDGVTPSNKDRGYILRRLMRRTMSEMGIGEYVGDIFKLFEQTYTGAYTLDAKRITAAYLEELKTFAASSEKGFKEITKKYMEDGKDVTVSGADAFHFFATFGITKEAFVDYYPHISKDFDREYEEAFKAHQELSRSGAEKKFKGGLADTSEMSVKYHTTTHLLHQALHDVLGDKVEQKGSNITPERLRFDFSHGAKMTDEEKKKVEDIVNQKIQENLPVQNVTMPKGEAEKTGARHFFAEKYGDEISVYFIGKDLQSAYSKEFCGGPHVTNTGILGKFKIQKEEAVAQGIRRIKAVLE